LAPSSGNSRDLVDSATERARSYDNVSFSKYRHRNSRLRGNPVQLSITLDVKLLCLPTDALFIQSIHVPNVLVVFCSGFVLPALINAATPGEMSIQEQNQFPINYKYKVNTEWDVTGNRLIIRNIEFITASRNQWKKANRVAMNIDSITKEIYLFKAKCENITSRYFWYLSQLYFIVMSKTISHLWIINDTDAALQSFNEVLL
jgi:hypothetical protein